MTQIVPQMPILDIAKKVSKQRFTVKSLKYGSYWTMPARVYRLYSREGCNLLSVLNCLQNLIALLGPRPDPKPADFQLPFPACPSDDLQVLEEVFPGSLWVHLELA